MSHSESKLRVAKSAMVMTSSLLLLNSCTKPLVVDEEMAASFTLSEPVLEYSSKASIQAQGKCPAEATEVEYSLDGGTNWQSIEENSLAATLDCKNSGKFLVSLDLTSTPAAVWAGSPAGDYHILFRVKIADQVSGPINQVLKGKPPTLSLVAGFVGGAGSLVGQGTEARFSYPVGMALDSIGNLYISDFHAHEIRKIDQNGFVSKVAGLSTEQGHIDGPAANARFLYPSGLALDQLGNLFISDGINHSIRRIAIDGTVSTLIRGGLSLPRDLKFDSLGNLYVADSNNRVIRKITPAGAMSIFAGAELQNEMVDGIGTAARFHFPMGLAIDASDNIYVTEAWGNTIRKITPSGSVTTFAGLSGSQGSTDGAATAARFLFPTSVAVDSVGNLFVTDAGNHTIRKITSAGTVTTFAGSPGLSGTLDGTGANARFKEPMGIIVDEDGNLFVADSGNSTIRKITPAGVVSTIAGSSPQIESRDGQGSSARFILAQGMAFDLFGNLLVAE